MFASMLLTAVLAVNADPIPQAPALPQQSPKQTPAQVAKDHGVLLPPVSAADCSSGNCSVRYSYSSHERRGVLRGRVFKGRLFAGERRIFRGRVFGRVFRGRCG